MSFPAYATYWDSGVEWIGHIPFGWQVRPLKSLARLITGITPPSDDSENYAEEGYPWIRPEDIDETGVAAEASKFLTEKGASFARVFPGPAILICCIGTIGKTGYVELPFTTNQQITSLVRASVPRHLFYCIQAARAELEVSSTGNVLRILNAERLGRVSMPASPVEDATKIVAFLDHETAKIDALVAEQERLIALLKEKRQAVISHAVTKGLDPNAPMKDSGVEWLGQVPAHWEVKPLKRLIKPGASISYGIVQPGEPQDDGVPFIQTTNISAGVLDLDTLPRTTYEIAAGYPRSQLSGGEVILGIRASIGAAYVVPAHLTGANLSRGIARIDNSAEINSAFLVNYLRSNTAFQYWGLSKQGSTFNEVSIETVRELLVAIPPLIEQQDITGYLSERSDLLDMLTAEATTAITLLRERRAALISAAVTGKIDVRGFVRREQQAA